MSNAELIALANRLIPPPDGQAIVLYENGVTVDIVKEVLDCYRDYVYQLSDFAPYLRGNDFMDTCKNVWMFVKRNIRYKEDPEGKQWIQTPARIWQRKICDCKGYAIFIASLLQNLGIKGNFRFVSFDPDDPAPTHVYVYVATPSGNIILDDVMDAFNTEERFYFYKDYPMTQISRLSGISRNVVNRQQRIITPPRRKYSIYGIDDYIDYSGKNDHIGDLLAPVKKLLSGEKAHDLVVQLSPAMLYIFIPNKQGAPQGGIPDHNMPNIIAQMPSVVQQKQVAAYAIREFIHSKWGYNYSDTTPPGGLVRTTLTNLLGMDPQTYLGNAIGYDIGNKEYLIWGTRRKRIGTTGPGLTNPFPTSVQNAPGQTTQNATTLATSGAEAAATGGADIQADAQAAQAAQQLLLSIASSVINFNVTPDPSTAMPMVTDWAGFQTAMQIGKYLPTANDPLGVTGNNGGTLSTTAAQNAQTTTNAAGQTVYTNPNPSTTNPAITPVTAGLSTTEIILLAGAAFSILAMMNSGGKRKRA